MLEHRPHARLPAETAMRIAGASAHAVRTVAAAGLAGLALLLMATGFAATAHAQGLAVHVVVNGEAITTRDIDQRARLLQTATRQRPSRSAVIEELIDEKIKLGQARKLGVGVSESMVDRMFAGMAQQSGMTSENFAAALQQAGVDSRLFRARLRADLAWREVLQRMSPGIFQVRDADMVAALTARGERPSARAIQYNLREIVFVVPRGASAAARNARVREAESLRQKFTSCEEGVQVARGSPEVVVLDAKVQLSTDLPQRLQQLLEKTPDGRLTPPEPTQAGISVVAVCGRQETVADLSSRSEVREELLTQRIEATEKQILERLRRQAIIEYR